MKMLNGSKVVVMLALAVVAPAVRAEQSPYENYVNKFDSSFPQAKSVADSFGNQGVSTEDLMQKIFGYLKTNKKNQEGIERILKGRKEIEDLTLLNARPASALNDIVSKNAQRDQQLAQAFQSLPQNPFGSQAANINTSNYDQSCTTNVPTGQISQVVQFWNQQIGQDKGQVAKILEKRAGETEEQRDQILAKSLQEFMKMAKISKEEDEFQDNVLSKRNLNPLEAKAFEKKLTDKWEEQQQTKQDLAMQFIQTMFKDFIPKVRKIGKNNKDLAALQAQMGPKMQYLVQQTQQTVVSGAEAAFRNCLQKADELGVNSPLGPNTKFNQAYQAIVAMHAGNADYWANPVFLTMASQVARQSGCSNITNDVNNAMAQLQTAASAITSAPVTDPATLLTAFSTTMNAVGTTMQQLQPIFDKSFGECHRIVNHGKALDQMVAQMNASGGAPGARRGAAQPRLNSVASHNSSARTGR